MKRPLTALAAVVLIAVPVAACGSDDEGEDGGSGATTTQTSTGPAKTTPASGKTVRVSMKEIRYIPRDVTVGVGDKIVWTNDDPVAHTATSDPDGGKFDSGTVQQGKTFEYVAREKGKIPYVCTIHPTQTGSITVR